MGAQVLRVQSGVDLPALSHSVPHHAQREVKACPCARICSWLLSHKNIHCGLMGAATLHVHILSAATYPILAPFFEGGRALWPLSGARQPEQHCEDPARRKPLLTWMCAHMQIESASCLQHQNIARLLDVFAHGDQLVLVVRGPNPSPPTCPILWSSLAHFLVTDLAKPDTVSLLQQQPVFRISDRIVRPRGRRRTDRRGLMLAQCELTCVPVRWHSGR